ncbi:MAG TPA: DUF1015 domain-containing protein [Nitrospirota bacterium]|nr:DUF1015 domain-containing protein [Nitrospirota bacterium]
MAIITPFRGILYNQAKAGEMSNLICPPYDVISSADREALYGKSLYNIVRLEYGLESPADTDIDNRYTRAAALLEEWFRKDLLQQDRLPAIYIYEMEYKVGKATRKLRGFVCLVKIEDYQSGIIKPHETTLSGPKMDRLRLLRACRANFSQIYALFSDPSGTIAAILADVTRKPDREVLDTENVVHRLWSLSEIDSLKTIVREMTDKRLFIADGHHRYDTALNYRNECRSAAEAPAGEESYDYVSMFLARLEDSGITILPAHRILFNLTDFRPQQFTGELKRYFNIERIDFTKQTDAKNLETVLHTMGHRADRSHVFGMRIKGENSYYLLTLRSESDMDTLLQERSSAYRRLDVSILHHLIIDKLLGIDINTHKLGLNIEYIKDVDEAVRRVKRGTAEIVFFMNPTKVNEVKDVASTGERMPQKATYFYPKLATGLVMRKLD